MKPHRWQRKQDERRFRNHTKNQEAAQPDKRILLSFPETPETTVRECDIVLPQNVYESLVARAKQLGVPIDMHTISRLLNDAYEMAMKGGQDAE